MAGMEQLQIHSKSYLVRWIDVPAGHSISWSIQPHKKSLNFGVFKHPGTANGAAPNLPSSAVYEQPATPAAEQAPKGKAEHSKSEQTKVVEKLQGLGYKSVAWTGRCDADKVTLGRYDVKDGEGGMYGLVIDNTFSKQVSKTATLVLMTHPTNAVPKSGASLHFSQAFASGSASSLASKNSPRLVPISDSTDSLPQDSSRPTTLRPKSSHGNESSAFYTGVLQKKRRKRNQGYARRFFSLDFTSSTLSYYRNSHSSALRGSIPLALAELGVNEKRKEISVDSGAEVWRLKALNKKDFEGWRNALIRAADFAHAITRPRALSPQQSFHTAHPPDPATEREWDGMENLVGRVAGIRDAVRRLAQDTDPKYKPALAGLGIGRSAPSTSPSPTDIAEAGDYFGQEGAERAERTSFWKRKASSSGNSHSPSALFRRSVSAQLAVPSPSLAPQSPNGNLGVPKRAEHTSSQAPNEEVHDHCMAILRDLDSVVSEFSAICGKRRQRKTPGPPKLSSRDSIDSATSEEFYDARDVDTPASRSGFLTIRRDSDDQDVQSDVASDAGSASSSEDEGPGTFERTPREGQSSIFPSKPKSLTPLPLDRVQRRTTIAPAKVAPPSLIGFLRKNVGKDLSTIAMPVSANEPTSLLQRFSEQMEYTELLDSAVTAADDTGERILYVTAFALSTFSNSRVKERAIRKPFNPMLGETYELVREDKGFRFIAEKISHRPVRMACQAEAKDWAFLQSPMPVQKFWGKSAELNTDGRAHVLIHSTGEHYSWTIATSFLRNIIAGEKYVEPVGTMTVVCETSGAKAVATFKAGGMFAGRSEDVTVKVSNADGGALPLGLTGKWTSHLNLTKDGNDTGDSIWAVGPLVDNAPTRYGFTAFAATLNEVTSVERDHIPITDSRLRPDQRAAEDGDLDGAEGLKARLEERQRARRRVMEEHGDSWVPRWFVNAGAGSSEGEELWKLKTGKEGYWEERERGEWTKVVDIFQT